MGATVVPLAGLAWLAWAIVQRDGADRRERALDQAVTSLTHHVQQIDDRLGTIAQSSAPDLNDALTGSATAGEASVVFDRTGVLARSGTPLPYVPAPIRSAELPDVVFARANEEEHVRTNFAAALTALTPLTR